MSTGIQITKILATLDAAEKSRKSIGKTAQVSPKLEENYTKRVRALEATRQETPVRAAMSLA